MKFLISFLLWLVWLLVVALGFIAIPILLSFNWKGYTTWWGNKLYGKYGNGTSLTRSNPFLFLAVRNPASNFGKFTLGVSREASWPWYVDNDWIRYGWATSVDERTNTRKFYFNPFKKLNKKFWRK